MLTFHITKPRSWLGNNMGYDPAEWVARTDFKTVAKIAHDSLGWSIWWETGESVRRLDTLKEAKALVRKRFEIEDNEPQCCKFAAAGLDIDKFS